MVIDDRIFPAIEKLKMDVWNPRGVRSAQRAGIHSKLSRSICASEHPRTEFIISVAKPLFPGVKGLTFCDCVLACDITCSLLGFLDYFVDCAAVVDCCPCVACVDVVGVEVFDFEVVDGACVSGGLDRGDGDPGVVGGVELVAGSDPRCQCPPAHRSFRTPQLA